MGHQQNETGIHGHVRRQKIPEMFTTVDNLSRVLKEGQAQSSTSKAGGCTGRAEVEEMKHK